MRSTPSPSLNTVKVCSTISHGLNSPNRWIFSLTRITGLRPRGDEAARSRIRAKEKMAAQTSAAMDALVRGDMPMDLRIEYIILRDLTPRGSKFVASISYSKKPMIGHLIRIRGIPPRYIPPPFQKRTRRLCGNLNSSPPKEKSLS